VGAVELAVAHAMSNKLVQKTAMLAKGWRMHHVFEGFIVCIVSHANASRVRYSTILWELG
jgi:hypothetical protein